MTGRILVSLRVFWAPIKWLIFRRVWWLLILLAVLELISQSSNFSRITILRNGVFLPFFSKYVLFVWNKLCPPIKWLIFRRAWWLLILLTVLELISQSSNFARITILRNGVFSPLFSKYVLFVWNKLCPPIKWLIFRRVWAPLILLTVLELPSQSSNFARITILRNQLSKLFCDAVKLFLCHKNMCNNVMIITTTITIYYL